MRLLTAIRNTFSVAIVAAGLAGGLLAVKAEETPLPTEGREAVRAWIAAVASGDPAVVGRVLAPDFQIVRADGSVHDRAGYLASSLPVIAAIPAVEDLVVTGEGDTIVTSYVISIDETRDGKVVERRAPRLTVFRRSAGGWLVVAHGNFARLEQ